MAFFQDNLHQVALERQTISAFNEARDGGWQWHQLNHMQIICTLLQTDNHASTSPLSFYRPATLPAAQPTVSKHWMQHLQLALWILSRTTWVSQYQMKHSPTHTHRGHQSSIICFLHPLWSVASFLFNLCAWQSFSTISVQVLFGLPFGLRPFTSFSIHFFIKSLSFLQHMPIPSQPVLL